ncbi:MAG: carbon storage regulator CsrA [Planctomycetota bacterium]|nr:carbon storage regulator CsrA [Planctomycetota bacterium]
MLVLSRKKNEQIVIGDGIVITIVDVRRDKVRIGIEAPTHVPVHRHEVYLALQQEAQATPAAANEAADEA